MGGGYYDRTLCQLLRPKATPQLIGLAYDFQKLATLPAEPWDIMLNRVVTPKR